MIELELNEMFSAAHALREYPGACSRIHGHNWTVTARLKAGKADANGMTVDYAVLKKLFTGILNRFDHNLINDIPYFQSINPTSERIAEYIYDEFAETLPSGLHLLWIRVSETDAFSVIFSKDGLPREPET